MTFFRRPTEEQKLPYKKVIWWLLFLGAVFLFVGFKTLDFTMPSSDQLVSIEGVVTEAHRGYTSHSTRGLTRSRPALLFVQMADTPVKAARQRTPFRKNLCIEELNLGDIVSGDTVESLVGARIRAATFRYDNCDYIYALEANGTQIFTYQEARQAIVFDNYLAAGVLMFFGAASLILFLRAAYFLFG